LEGIVFSKTVVTSDSETGGPFGVQPDTMTAIISATTTEISELYKFPSPACGRGLE